MATNLYGCTNCGYLMDASAPGLCFPCLIANAKSAMSVALAPRSALGSAAPPKQASSKTSRRAAGVQRLQVKRPPDVRKSTQPAKSDAITRLASSNWQPGGKNSTKKPSNLICSLCSAAVAEGAMLAHVRANHREMLAARSAAKRRSKRMWVSVVQGGLPSLGKRR